MNFYVIVCALSIAPPLLCIWMYYLSIRPIANISDALDQNRHLQILIFAGKLNK